MEQPGKPNWSGSESYTISMFGAAGVAMAHLSGEPGYAVYTVDGVDGIRYQVAAGGEFSIGTCIEFWAIKKRPGQTHWMYGEAFVTVKECP